MGQVTIFRSGEQLFTKRLKSIVPEQVKDSLTVLSWQKDLPHTTPILTRRKLLKGGFKGLSQVIYTLDLNDSRNYLSDIAVRRANRKIKNPMSSAIMNSKLLTHMVLQDYFNVPEVFAVVVKGEITPLRKGAKVKDFATLLEHCLSFGGVILKPTDGRQGQGVISLKGKEGNLYVRDQKVEEKDIHQLISSLDSYQVESFVEQAAYASTIYPHVTNTMRVLTMRDPARNHEPFIAFAIHKFGTKESAPVDNWAKGGLSSLLDLETGELGPGAGYPVYNGGKLIWFDRHPETGAQITGTCVPGWLGLKEQLLEMLSALKFLIYIGWDIAFTPQGPLIIEGNTGPAVSFLQVHTPLLKDPRIKRFYAYHQVL